MEIQASINLPTQESQWVWSELAEDLGLVPSRFPSRGVPMLLISSIISTYGAHLAERFLILVVGSINMMMYFICFSQVFGIACFLEGDVLCQERARLRSY